MKVIAALIAVLMLYSKTDAQKKEFFYYEKKKLNIENDPNGVNRGMQMVEGDRTVFEITIDNLGSPEVDAKVVEKIYFEVSTNKKKFKYKNAKIKSGYYGQTQCRCADGGYQPIKNGLIIGTKLPNGNWKVDIDVYAIGKNTKKKYEFKFSEEFKKKE